MTTHQGMPINVMLTRVWGQPRVKRNIKQAAALNYFEIFPQPIGGGGARAWRSSPDLVKNK